MSFSETQSDTTLRSVSNFALPALQSLNYCEHFCLWAIRTTVACTSVCRAMLREFHTAFDDSEVEAHAAFRAFLHSFGCGKRPIRIGRPGHASLTPDEVCLLELLRAAQFKDQTRFEAYGCWLMAGNQSEDLYVAAHNFTRLMLERGHAMRKPPVSAERIPAQAAAQWLSQRHSHVQEQRHYV